VSDAAAPVLAEGETVRVLTLNRPASLNAVDSTMHPALIQAVQEAAADPHVGAIVLAGAGRAFSAGGDLDHIRAMQTDLAARQSTLEAGHQLFAVMSSLAVPVIAAVHGPAVGAGCTLALMSDVVIAADDTYLADPHVSIGLVPGDGGATLWPLLTGLGAARYYLLTGDRIPAAEAQRLGLIHRVVPAGEVLPEAIVLGHRLSALPRAAVQGTKQALNLHVQQAAAATLEYALAAESACFDTPEHRRAVDELHRGRA
jgi:enoyl-CoA hydratase